MQALDEARHLNRPVRVRQPVQVNAKGRRVQRGEVAFDVKVRVLQHPHGQVDDADAQAVALQVLGNRRKADGIHLEHGRRRNQVTHRTVQDGLARESHRRWARATKSNRVMPCYTPTKDLHGGTLRRFQSQI